MILRSLSFNHEVTDAVLVDVHNFHLNKSRDLPQPGEDPDQNVTINNRLDPIRLRREAGQNVASPAELQVAPPYRVVLVVDSQGQLGVEAYEHLEEEPQIKDGFNYNVQEGNTGNAWKPPLP